jgi:uncharacterized membrane protein
MNDVASNHASPAGQARKAKETQSALATTNEPRRATTAAPARIARELGWFSLGLGLTEILAPKAVTRLVGVRDGLATRWIVRALGVRELAAGVGLLTQPRRPGWLWARASGDVIDLALLGSALFSPRTKPLRAGVAITAVVGITALDAWAGQQALERGPAPVRRTISIRKPPKEVFAFWRELTSLPRFMKRIEQVEVLDARRSRWRARGPAGATISWEAEITDERPGELLAWKSADPGALHHEGAVRFTPAPDGRSTEVHVSLTYGPDRGSWAAIKSIVAPLSDAALGVQLETDLGRFKQLLETGHIMKSDASIHPGMHPGRPSARAVEGGAS